MTSQSNGSSSKNVRFYTLGCKVNQYETQAMREAVERKGFCDVEGQKEAPCDLVILNTCTVTEEADRTNRYWIRRLRREHPGARLGVTGCYVQRNREDIEAMPEVDFIFSNDEKALLAERISEVLDTSFLPSGAGGKGEKKIVGTEFLPLSISRSEGRTRAYVKIQDGCDHGCSYCKVSLIRGKSRSRSLREIQEEVIRLRDSGYREIILAGIQLGAYGRDFRTSSESHAGQNRLREVIELCAAVEGIERIRLGSIEITDVDESLFAAFRDVPKFCPHLHIPLQSGDNEVLKRMNRRYTREVYQEVILRLKEQVRDFVLSVDVMVGFPEETEAQFENTVELLKILRPLKSHVFPYSRREGTLAASWKGFPVKIIRDRARRLIKITEKISHEVQTQYLARTYDVLVEERQKGTEISEGRTANYLKVFFKYPRAVQGCIITAHLDDFFQDGFWGTIIE